MNLVPKISNVCGRCGSDQIEIHPNKIYTCKGCGKADKGFYMKMRFEFPREGGGEPEVKIVRNLPREMAGQMADHIGKALAVGIAATIESYGAQIPKNVAPMLLTRAIAASFESTFQIVSAFLPLELQQQLAEYNALVSRANALMEAARNAGDGGEGSPQPGEGAGDGGPAGVVRGGQVVPPDGVAEGAVGDRPAPGPAGGGGAAEAPGAAGGDGGKPADQ